MEPFSRLTLRGTIYFFSWINIGIKFYLHLCQILVNELSFDGSILLTLMLQYKYVKTNEKHFLVLNNNESI